MKRIVSAGLLSLLLCHTLAYVLVLLRVNDQEERDLTSSLRVYRSVDSIVEFYIPLHESASVTDLPQESTDGFAYKENFYEIIRQEIQHDTLHILGVVTKTRSLWQQDLLSFIKHQFIGEGGQAQKKASHLLKNLLKEYCPFSESVIYVMHCQWREVVHISSFLTLLTDRPIPVQSPPPRV